MDNWKSKEIAGIRHGLYETDSDRREEVKNLNNTNGKMESRWVAVNLFPEALITLNRECAEHPVLMDRLANHPMIEWEVKLAEIANYCEVVLDGDYMPEDIDNICDILYRKLVAKRASLGTKDIIIVGSRY